MNDEKIICSELFKIKKLNDDGLVEVPIMNTQKYKNTRYGDWGWTEKDFDDIEKNLNDNVLGRVVNIDIDHDGTNNGEVKGFFRRTIEIAGKKLKELVAKVQLKKKELADKYLYASPYTNENFNNKLTGENVGTVLKAVAFTNDPFQPNLSKIKALNDNEKILILNDKQIKKEGSKMSEQTIKILNEKLSESAKILFDKDSEIKVLSDENVNLKSETKKLSDEVKKLNDEKAAKEKADFDAEVSKFLTDNSTGDSVKILPKQLDSFKKLCESKEGFESVKVLVEATEPMKLADGTSGNSDSKKLADGIKGSKDDPAIKKLTDGGKMVYTEAYLEVYPNGHEEA